MNPADQRILEIARDRIRDLGRQLVQLSAATAADPEASVERLVLLDAIEAERAEIRALTLVTT